jgi:peptidoglycan hydrolase CwlO-like protein
MLKRAILAGILIAVGGCAPQDAESLRADSNQPSAAQIAQQEAARQLAALQSEIHLREQSRDLVFTSLNGHQQRIQSLRGSSSELSNELETLNNDVAAYLMDHKIAVACIGAAGMAVSDDNEFSQDVKDVSKPVAIACVLALLSSDFRSEIAGVVDRLVQADSQAKNLRSQIRTLDDQIAQEANGSAADQARYDSLTSEIQQLQLRLQ